MSRYLLFARRIYIAHTLGFRFFGTSHTSPPRKVWLAGKERILAYPDDPAMISDVINLWLDDEYGLREIKQPVTTIVDIGANVGLFSLWARHHFRDAIIHAYEPNPEIFDYAAGNLRQMNVSIFREGVASANSSARLVAAKSSRLVRTEKTPKGEIKLRGIADVVDRIGGRIDLLKIDCEGAEWEIFEQHDAFRNVHQIRMEYHLLERRDLARFEHTMGELGFQIIKLITNRNFGIAWLENAQLFGNRPAPQTRPAQKATLR